MEAAVDRAYPAWAARDVPDAGAWRAALEAAPAPLISVLMPVWETAAAHLRAAIGSVLGQIAENWELVIADDASTAPHVGAVLAEAAGHPRVRVLRLPARAGVSGATNAALAAARGPWVAFLDHDDLLAPHAVAALTLAIAAHPEAGLIFSDEDQLVAGQRAAPYFKPGVNVDLLACQNVIGHLACYRTELVRTLGGLRPETDGSQDHDLALRAVAALGTRRVAHVPRVLYHWRQGAASLSATQAERCRRAARFAIADTGYLVEPDDDLPWPVVRPPAPAGVPTLHVVGALPAAADGVAVRPFAAGDEVTGLVAFLPRGLEVAAGALRMLASHLAVPGVGAAGPLLLGPDGAAVGQGRVLDAHRGSLAWPGPADAADPGYRGALRRARSVGALPLAGLVVRAEALAAVGGVQGSLGAEAGSDLCLRLAEAGWRAVWSPLAVMRWAAPGRPEAPGAARMREKWGDRLARDPYLNPNLVLAGGRVRLAPPRTTP